MKSFFSGTKILQSHHCPRLAPQVAGNDLAEVAPRQGMTIDLNDQITREDSLFGRRHPFNDVQYDKFAFGGWNHLQTNASENLFAGQGGGG